MTQRRAKQCSFRPAGYRPLHVRPRGLGPGPAPGAQQAAVQAPGAHHRPGRRPERRRLAPLEVKSEPCTAVPCSALPWAEAAPIAVPQPGRSLCPIPPLLQLHLPGGSRGAVWPVSKLCVHCVAMEAVMKQGSAVSAPAALAGPLPPPPPKREAACPSGPSPHGTARPLPIQFQSASCEPRCGVGCGVG